MEHIIFEITSFVAGLPGKVVIYLEAMISAWHRASSKWS